VAWLYQIARNTAYDYLRRSQGIVITDIYAADIELRDNRIARFYPDLPEQLAKLSPSTQHVLLLYGAGYQIQEIAAVTGKTTMAIKHLISRGRQRLRAWTGEH
jgi:RNA polymerase sigma factor (sigma-70 family)